MSHAKKPRMSNWTIALILLMIIGLFIVPVWMMVNRIWPASWLIDLQLSLLGKYYPRGTAAIVFMLLVLAVLFVGTFISWAGKKLRSPAKDWSS